MNLQAFCFRGGLGLLALGAAGYAGLALWLPPAARSAAPVATSVTGPVLVAAAPPRVAPVAVVVPPPALPEPPPAVHAALPPSAAPVPRPVHRTPEPRAGRSARAVAAGPGGRERARGHALRTAAESAEVSYPVSPAGSRAYATRRVY